MPTHAEFWDRIAEKYARDPIRNMDAYQAGLVRVRSWLRPDMHMLELGCGTGSTALELSDAVASVHGTDISAEMVRIATAKAATAGRDHVRFSQATADGIGSGASYDVITAFNLLHLVPDPARVIAQAHAVLPSGGLFISKTPCLGRKLWMRPLIGLLQVIGKAPRPVHSLHPEGIEAMLTEQGFEITETGGYPAGLPNYLIVARKL